MLRLFSIEFFKLSQTKYFWVLSILFVLFLLAVPIGAKLFLDYLFEIGENPFQEEYGITADEIPLYDFIDIWQNLTWVYKSFSLFLGFITVISVCNEFSYGTIKQNVIDGLSRNEFLLSKVSFIVVASFVVSFLVFCIGLVLGLLWSPVVEVPFIFKNIEFIGAYFLHLIAFQMLCLVVALLIKRSGIVIALMVFYVYVVENILTGLLYFHYKWELASELLPVQAIGNIIRVPFPKYLFRETQTYVGAQDLLILLGYMALLGWIAWWQTGKRDLA